MASEAQECGGALARLARFTASARGTDAAGTAAKLPLLVLRVRGHAAMLVTLEATTGLLCLSAGASAIRGHNVATVRLSVTVENPESRATECGLTQQHSSITCQICRSHVAEIERRFRRSDYGAFNQAS